MCTDPMQLLGGLFISALLNITGAIVGGIYTKRWTEIQVVLVRQKFKLFW